MMNGARYLIFESADPIDTLQPGMAESAFFRDYSETKHAGLGRWPRWLFRF